ncbi:CoA ester lyase [Rhodococcus sp. HNM0563]|uniref:HpcH/HpaI aldolase/citrate lyase family protein n=1 Tax=unclassified Rhodococcus (in: high G+C Gram-positive bacteria) TaxID=192944 RepID=UPI00146C5F2A|nr:MULTISPECIES: CoA ester lyase [unclassified Rhodococcus (in: high G+C Gram-positive bacteria)]MCK0093874.1 CoA ester lyase [Rhodococcus sp. F64268]NLU64484.1 CoA ester lyase [Rhodococcus sp. HNM0563]
MSVIPGPAWLFCPADRPERYGKAAATADVVVLDLDDSVAPADKDYARRSLLDRSLDPARTVIRVGPSGTDEHHRDLRALADTPYTRVMLARCESPEQVTALAPLEVVALVDSPRGVLAVAEIALAMGTIGVMWGAEGLAVALGGQSIRHADGTYRDVAKHVRSSVLLAAKAYGRWALDAAHPDIGDHSGLRSETLDAAAVGFDAKVAIHPDQVGVIRAAYAPSSESVEWARRVLAAVPESRGAFRFEGQMVDAPVLRHAEQILHRSVEARANDYRSDRTEVEPERR